MALQPSTWPCSPRQEPPGPVDGGSLSLWWGLGAPFGQVRWSRAEIDPLEGEQGGQGPAEVDRGRPAGSRPHHASAGEGGTEARNPTGPRVGLLGGESWARRGGTIGGSLSRNLKPRATGGRCPPEPDRARGRGSTARGPLPAGTNHSQLRPSRPARGPRGGRPGGAGGIEAGPWPSLLPALPLPPGPRPTRPPGRGGEVAGWLRLGCGKGANHHHDQEQRPARARAVCTSPLLRARWPQSGGLEH